MVQTISRLAVLPLLIMLASCGGGDEPGTNVELALKLESRAGIASAPHRVGEPALVGLPPGDRLTITASQPVRWRLEYQGQSSYGFSRNLQFSTITVTERTSSNPSMFWSADIAGAVPPGKSVSFTVIAETTPETEFQLSVRQ